jgi:hypothetical protein
MDLEVKHIHITPLHWVDAMSGMYPRREAPGGWAILGADLSVMAAGNRNAVIQFVSSCFTHRGKILYPKNSESTGSTRSNIYVYRNALKHVGRFTKQVS